MNRPDTKKTVFNDEKPYKINPKYVCDLEKYCDELEEEYKLLKGDYEDQKAIFTDVIYETTQKLEKYKWHDLRKDSNDLPKENGLYLVILLPPNKEFLFRKTELIIYSDLMGICKEKHWNNGRVGSNDYENYDERVIAWKYIDIGEFEDE